MNRRTFLNTVSRAATGLALASVVPLPASADLHLLFGWEPPAIPMRQTWLLECGFPGRYERTALGRLKCGRIQVMEFAFLDLNISCHEIAQVCARFLRGHPDVDLIVKSTGYGWPVIDLLKDQPDIADRVRELVDLRGEKVIRVSEDFL
jgi:hypothetical protein